MASARLSYRGFGGVIVGVATFGLSSQGMNSSWSECVARTKHVASVSGEEVTCNAVGRVELVCRFLAEQNGNELVICRASDKSGLAPFAEVYLRQGEITIKGKVTKDSSKFASYHGAFPSLFVYNSLWKGDVEVVGTSKVSFAHVAAYQFAVKTETGTDAGTWVDSWMADHEMDLFFDAKTYLPLGWGFRTSSGNLISTHRYRAILVNRNTKAWPLSREGAIKEARLWLRGSK